MEATINFRLPSSFQFTDTNVEHEWRKDVQRSCGASPQATENAATKGLLTHVLKDCNKSQVHTRFELCRSSKSAIH